MAMATISNFHLATETPSPCACCVHILGSCLVVSSDLYFKSGSFLLAVIAKETGIDNRRICNCFASLTCLVSVSDQTMAAFCYSRDSSLLKVLPVQINTDDVIIVAQNEGNGAWYESYVLLQDVVFANLRSYFFIAARIAQIAWLIWIALAEQLGQTGHEERSIFSMKWCSISVLSF